MDADGAVVAGLAEKFSEFRPHADERGWRFYLGSEARAYAREAGCGIAAAAGRGPPQVGGGAAGVKAGAAGAAGARHAGRSGGGGDVDDAVAAGPGAPDGRPGVPVREGRAGAAAARGRLQPAGHVAVRV